MKWLKNLVASRVGRVKIMWTITFFLLIITFLTWGQPVLTSNVNRQMEILTDGDRNKPLYDDWHKGQKDLAKIQGYDYKDPREVKKESVAWSWKWGIAFLIFLSASFIYTGAAAAGGSYDYLKEKIEKMEQSGKHSKWKWIALIIFLTSILSSAVTAYTMFKLAGKGLEGIGQVAGKIVSGFKSASKGVSP